jgi:bifunctional non-homologous end joining protein LigD
MTGQTLPLDRRSRPEEQAERQFVIDGEAVMLGVDGYSDFNALHSGKHNEEVQLCAFDDDLRDLPLSMRKANLARLLAPRDGIFISDFEHGRRH